MVERFHRTLKAALMCHAQTSWPESLPLVILGLRNCYKEDLQASPAEMVYGTSLHILGEFFVITSFPMDSASFVARLVETARKPLEQPYSDPHEDIRHLNEKVYVVRVDGVEETIATNALKPAYLDSADVGVKEPPGVAERRSSEPTVLPAPLSSPLPTEPVTAEPSPSESDGTTPSTSTDTLPTVDLGTQWTSTTIFNYAAVAAVATNTTADEASTLMESEAAATIMPERIDVTDN
ncbi:uncharacterized protein LOC131669457 [Phymastichus coffea]|uniref:uncharacterized protein LOC131669457 n=1 Tax=Phymastichus coffea TaxID=108790 RepID=UPI00273C113B|nr:uncharacterized protein LOC131669457 [Phymastichus coffea]